MLNSRLFFAPTHCFDNNNEIMSISRMYQIISPSRYVMLIVSNVLLLSNAVINNVFYILNMTKYISNSSYKYNFFSVNICK